jgi:hypothetical protein
MDISFFEIYETRMHDPSRPIYFYGYIVTNDKRDYMIFGGQKYLAFPYVNLISCFEVNFNLEQIYFINLVEDQNNPLSIIDEKTETMRSLYFDDLSINEQTGLVLTTDLKLVFSATRIGARAEFICMFDTNYDAIFFSNEVE